MPATNPIGEWWFNKITHADNEEAKGLIAALRKAKVQQCDLLEAQINQLDALQNEIEQAEIVEDESRWSPQYQAGCGGVF